MADAGLARRELPNRQGSRPRHHAPLGHFPDVNPHQKPTRVPFHVNEGVESMLNKFVVRRLPYAQHGLDFQKFCCFLWEDARKRNVVPAMRTMPLAHDISCARAFANIGSLNPKMVFLDTQHYSS